MKKTFLLSALCAMALCSCGDDDEITTTQFGHAEIYIDLAGADFQGDPSGDLLNYYDITVTGADFDQNEYYEALNTSNKNFTFSCSNTPTADNSLFASLHINATPKDQIPDDGTYNIDYSIHIHYKLFDKAGNELTSGFIIRSTSHIESMSKEELEREMEFYNRSYNLELCYVQDFFTGEWMYNLHHEQLPN